MPSLYSIKELNTVNYWHQKSDIIPIDFHIHDGFEIYFLISGDVNYFIEKKIYPLKYGDLIITNNYEVHMPTFQSSKVYERIILQFGPEIPEKFSSPQLNLLNCFINRPLGMQNKISLDKYQLEELLRLFKRIDNLNNLDYPGSEILKLTSFIDLLVFINRIFTSIKPVEEHPNVPEKLVPILDYIDIILTVNYRLNYWKKGFI